MTVAGQRYDVSPLGEGKNWVNKVGGLPLFARAIAHALMRNGHTESEAIQMAIGVMKNWASGQGKVTARTRAKSAAAIAEWEAKKAAAHATRDMGPVTESSSAGDLIPRGPTAAQAKAIDDELAGNPHAFRGSDLESCSVCDKPVSDPIHTAKRASTGKRHRGAGHSPVQTGHVAGNVTRRRVAQKAAFNAQADEFEPQMADAMRTVFDKQASATLSRMAAKRGEHMLLRAGISVDHRRCGRKGGSCRAWAQLRGMTWTCEACGWAARSQRTIRAAQQPPTEPPPEGQPPTQAPDVAQIFDMGHWVQATADAAIPVYEAMGAASRNRVRTQLGPVVQGADESSSIGSVASILRSRANQMAGEVTQTTFNQLQDSLAQGAQAGESVPQLTDRVRQVFDQASKGRAQNIARTEVVGSLNQAANAYAEGLPKNVVGRKEWLAHRDQRTRPTHRMADGQQAPMGMPFHVGMSLMSHPGDPSAPPDEVCGCRCSVAYLPAASGLSLKEAA